LNELVSRPGVLGGLIKSMHDNTTLPAVSSGIAAAADDARGRVDSDTVHALSAMPAIDDARRRVGRNTAVLAEVAAKAGAKAAQEANTDRPTDAAREQLSRAFADFTSFDAGAADGGGSSPLEQYRQQLDGVLAAVKAYREDETKLEPLATAAEAALESSERLVRAHGGSWNAQLRGLLLPVLAGIAQLTVHARGEHLARSFCDSVYAPFHQDLAGRFPSKPDSSDAASLVAFTRFFQPGTGTVASFLNTQLAGYVTAAGGGFRFTSAHARSLLRDDLLSFLQRTAAVTKAFFPDGATGLRVPFRIRVRGAPGYSVTMFRAGTRSIRYDSGEERWTLLDWPGEEPSHGVGLFVTPYQGTGPKPLVVENPWGLFMILQPRFGAQVLERTSKQLTVGWRPKGNQHFVKVDFAYDDPRGPFNNIPFGRAGLFPFSVPSRIANLGGACGTGGP
jgi:type VI protein secretion system component VasK